jgi:hypothetical protein
MTSAASAYEAPKAPAAPPAAAKSSDRVATSSRPIPTPMDSVRAVVTSAARDASHPSITARPKTRRRRSWGAVAAMVGAFALLGVAIIAHGDAEGVLVAAKSLGSHGLAGDSVRSLARDDDQAEFRIVPLQGVSVPEPALPHHRARGPRTVVVFEKVPSPPPPDPPAKPAPPPPPQDDLTLAGTTPAAEPCDELCLWRLACSELKASGKDCGPAPGPSN